MKILQVIDSVSDDYGGPVIGVKNLAGALASKKHEITVCGTKSGINRAEKIKTRGFTLCAFPVQRPYGYYYSPELGNFIRKDAAGYDVVHIHGIWTYPSFIAARVCKTDRVPYIMRTCGMLDFWSMSQKALKKRMYFYFVEKQNLKNASFIQFSTEVEFKRSFYKKWDSSRIKYIPNVLYPEKIGARNAEPDSRLVNKKYILFFGALCYKKGLDVLLRAFSRLEREPAHKNIYLALMGPDRDNYFEGLKKKMSGFTAWDKVINLGMVYGERRFGIVRNALFMCLPSRQENLGLAIIETLACGVPVLVSDSVDIAQLVAKECAGKITNINPAALFSIMKEMINDGPERRRMGQNGKRLVYEKFDRETLLRQYLNMYREASKLQL
jgi:glycosyltransferase involved in cell wall biosynthesis